VCACLLLAGLAAGCSNTTTSPNDYAYAPYSQTDIVVGTGNPVVSGSIVTVQYTGWLYDAAAPDHKGIQFGTSENGTPFVFTVGLGGVIPAWDTGLPGMQVGGIRRLICPPSTAYGAARHDKIPPNSTLIFDITLIKIAS
jgi:FKBP-type peptidyl-prolyl cis-trans isomerase